MQCVVQRNLELFFLKGPWRVNDKCRKMTFVGRTLNVAGTQKKITFELKGYRNHKQIKSYVNTCAQINFFQRNLELTTVLFRNLMFRAEQCQFRVPNVLFVTTVSHVHVRM